jgi:hypothetical protein
MKTKIVEVELDGAKVPFKLKELTFGEYNVIMTESAKISISGEGNVDSGKFFELVLFYSIVEPAEYRQNREKIQSLPVAVAYELANVALELSGLSGKKNK